MATVFSNEARRLLSKGHKAKKAAVRGKAYEDLLCYIFGSLKGVTVRRRNKKNAFSTEEIDVALWNDRERSAVPFLPWLILAECKNWKAAVGSIEVSWFDQKLASRGLTFGILLAANGITGDSAGRTDAHSIISKSLAAGRRIIVLTGAEVIALTRPSGLVRLIKEKLCDLAVSGTMA